ncbi:DUF6234 family protein [Kitasatospora sp. NPDC059795]|uniref:DUF6234 family protein n=1 Tax=Kitasatospora sp. NPDC059795 TaxID=3346949 RepID=UPI0036682F34
MLALLCATAAVGTWLFLYVGLSAWASGGRETVDGLTVLFCFAALPAVFAAPAGWRRYWVTAVVHGLLALAVLAPAVAGYAYDHRHDGDHRPEPLPSDYRPCFSGSDCSATGG